MKSLGKQFEDIMMPRVRKRKKFGNVAQEAAKQLIEGAQNRSRKGDTVPHGDYDSNYAPSSKANGKRDPVTLRDKQYSIKRMRANRYGSGKARIRGSRKMWLHDRGKAKGGKRRQLFPDNMSQLPRGFINSLRKNIKRILSGESV